jgi:DNA mismatch endonuclease (patch repair protein)
MMSAVRNKGSKAELLLRRELWRRGFRYRLHRGELVGKPDVVFSRIHVVIFVDSDFWHARTLIDEGEAALRAIIRGKRQQWWVDKLKRNAARDVEVTAALRSSGWTVMRLWESQILGGLKATVDQVERTLLKKFTASEGKRRDSRSARTHSKQRNVLSRAARKRSRVRAIQR